MQKCSICGKEGKSIKYHMWRMHGEGINHNPAIGYTSDRQGWNKGKTKLTDERVAKNAAAIAESKKDLPSAGCFAWSTQQRSDAAKSQGFGGYRPNAGRSKKFKVLDSFGKETVLQSSFELRCSEILNELGIKWVRPKALKYSGKNYFADFYLVDLGIYLDPKNNYKAKLDAMKIASVIEENKVQLFVILEEQLTKEYIARLIQ